jgi:hypothetical protein
MKTNDSGKSGKIGTSKNAIPGAKELGVSAEAGVAASGASKGADEVSSTTLKTVPKAFTKTIHGVKVLAKEPEAALLSNN